MARSEEREHLMKMLYQMDLQKDFSAEAYKIYKEQQTKGDLTSYYDEIYRKFTDNMENVDDRINEFSVRWKTTRMPSIDLAILRLAITEIIYFSDIPDSVSINEAVNLAKKYSTENSSKFINGVLGKVVRADEK
ncbi:MAG: transcription antitermination factor NusB [Firmicutes bacterium]|nr:transcription antitermination factor NusB [Bacillota bacterium]